MEPNDDLKLKILAYLDGHLDDPGREFLLEELARHGIDENELEHFAGVLKKAEVVPLPEPPKELDERFYAMLRHEEYRQHAGVMRGLAGWLDRIGMMFAGPRLAFALIVSVLVIAFGISVYQGRAYREEIGVLNSEVREVRTMLVMTLLQRESAIDRLRAVNLTSSLPNDDDAVIHALLATLNNDPDVNVRLEAIDALLKRAGDPRVRRGLVDAIMQQTSPLVQVTLADAMVALQERRATTELKKLLEENSTNDEVRTKLKQSIEVLM